jgi:uncharacterized membrane protein YdjX (TVP38/TMEM64 family)
VAHGARDLAGWLLIPDAVPHHGAVRTDDVWLRAAVLAVLLLIGGIVALTVDVPDVDVVRAWVDGAGAAGWTALVLGLAVVLLLPVPRSAVSVLVGLVTGFGPGLAVAFAGALLSALAAFGLSRVLGRAAATRLAGARFGRVDELMARRGFVAVLTGRLLPMMPFVVLSYGAGLTAIRWAPYTAGTALGLIPSTVVQVGVGASAGAIVAGATPLTVVPVAAAAAVLAVVITGAWRRRRRATA